jgi:hypothetical protein
VLYQFRNVKEDGNWKLYSSINSYANENWWLMKKMEIKYRIKRLTTLEKDYDKASKEENIFVKFEKEDTEKKLKSLQTRTRLIKKHTAKRDKIRDLEREQEYLEIERQGKYFITKSF